MVKVYAVVLIVGVVALFAWLIARAFAVNIERPSIDPEERFGVAGRRVVAGMVGFGMAGMSAEFSPLGIPWPLACVRALLGAGAAVWYAGWAGKDEPTPAESETG